MRIKWLHVSDIHFSYPGFDSCLARDDFISFLHEIGETESFTDLFVTGDVLYKHTASSEITISFLNEVVTAMGISKEHVWIVPGNHDHCFDTCKDLLAEIYTQKDPSLAVDQLSDDEITKLIDSFEYYKDFCNTFYGNDKIFKERRMHWRLQLQDNSSIIGLNTAWLEHGSNKDPYIRIGLKQLLPNLSDKQHDADMLNIAIGHHPIDSLYKEDQERVLELFRRNSVRLYLCGHEHGAGAKYYQDSDVLQIDAAGLMIDGYSYGGFCIGTIDSSSGSQKVEFYKWNLADDHWCPERERIGVSIDGICYFERIKQNKTISNIAFDVKLLDNPIPDQEIYDLLKDSSTEIFRLSMKNATGIIGKDCWQNLREQLLQTIQAINERVKGKRLNIFPMAPIPLLVEMGYICQRNSAISVWQYDRLRNKWVQNDRNTDDCGLVINENMVKKSGQLIVSVATSVNITNGQIDQLISTVDNDTIKFHSDIQNVGYPLDAKIVKRFAQEICFKMTGVVGQYSDVHLFLSVPAGLAVEIGRWIQKSIFPNVHLYDYKAGYHYAYTINEVNHVVDPSKL